MRYEYQFGVYVDASDEQAAWERVRAVSEALDSIDAEGDSAVSGPFVVSENRSHGDAITITGTVHLDDTKAIDRIAVMLGANERWSGADVLESIARVIQRTGRPSVGDQSVEDLAMYRRAANEFGIAHDGPENDNEEG